MQEASNFFSQIPLRTLKDWHQKLVDTGEVEPVVTTPSEVLAPIKMSLTVLEGGQSEEDELLSDIEWCKRQCRQIYKSDFSNVTRVQALTVFLKALQIEQALKKDPVKTESEIIDVSQLENLSEEELAQLYKKHLG